MPDMMNVRRMAELSKLSLTEEEEFRLSREMEGILKFARQLQRLDVEGVPPTQHILDLTNVLRGDEIQLSMPQESILSAAPDREEAYISVPRTVE